MAQPRPRTKFGHQLSLGFCSSGITIVLQQSEQVPHCFGAALIWSSPAYVPPEYSASDSKQANQVFSSSGTICSPHVTLYVVSTLSHQIWHLVHRARRRHRTCRGKSSGYSPFLSC